jgi:hypothetical protein
MIFKTRSQCVGAPYHHTSICADNNPFSHDPAGGNAGGNTGGARLYGFMGLAGIAWPCRASEISASGYRAHLCCHRHRHRHARTESDLSLLSFLGAAIYQYCGRSSCFTMRRSSLFSSHNEQYGDSRSNWRGRHYCPAFLLLVWRSHPLPSNWLRSCTFGRVRESCG